MKKLKIKLYIYFFMVYSLYNLLILTFFKNTFYLQATKTWADVRLISKFFRTHAAFLSTCINLNKELTAPVIVLVADLRFFTKGLQSKLTIYKFE